MYIVDVVHIHIHRHKGGRRVGEKERRERDINTRTQRLCDTCVRGCVCLHQLTHTTRTNTHNETSKAQQGVYNDRVGFDATGKESCVRRAYSFYPKDGGLEF